MHRAILGFAVFMLGLAIVLPQPARADIGREIASIDRVMIRSCEVAEINAARATKDKSKQFLQLLTRLETQFRTAGDQQALLACLKARAKYDPSAKKIVRPTKIPEQLRILESSLQRQLRSIERNRTKVIADAKKSRVRKLMALQRGLVARGEREAAEKVFAAIRKTPSVPTPSPATMASGNAPLEFVYLTYNRPKKRWERTTKLGVRREVLGDTTTLHYDQGGHFLVKALWLDVLEEGARFSIEVKGVFSVELVDLEGADANARFALPETDKFIKVEIDRLEDRVAFVVDGKPLSTFYASGRLRGEQAKNALLATKLRAAISVKKGEHGSFRNVQIIKP